MLPLTFDNSLRPASLDTSNLFSITENTDITAESFQSHLHPAPSSPAAAEPRRDEPERNSENDPARAAAQAPATRDQTDQETPDAPSAPEDVVSDATDSDSSEEANDVHDKADAELTVATPVPTPSDPQQLEAVLTTTAAHSLQTTDSALSLDTPADPDAPAGTEQTANSTALFAAELNQEAEQANQPSTTSAKQNATPEGSSLEAQAVAVKAELIVEGSDITAEPARGKEHTRRGTTRETQSNEEVAEAGQLQLELAQKETLPVESVGPQAPERQGSSDATPQQNSTSPPPVTLRGTEDIAPPTTVTNRFAQHLLARGTERTSQSDAMPEIDQARFIERVARAFQAAEGRDGILRLRLSPPELGALRLELKVHEGVLTAQVEAETPAAKALLLEHLPVLRERLAEQGVRIEQFDVDLLDRHTGQTPERSDQQESGERHGRRTAAETVRTDTSSEGSALTVRPTYGSDGRLNVVV